MSPALTAADLRLRASPGFSFALMPDGRPYVAQEVEPYVHYWLSERERRLLAACSSRHGACVSDVVAAELARPHAGTPAAERRRLQRALQGLQDAGVLVNPQADPSRYDHAIVQAYLQHRPFPPEICAQIVQRAAIGPASAVLDLAGGPGDLALQLAAHSSQVTLMDWSRGFLQSARQRARALGRPLQTVHESCNRLVHDDGSYDVLTVCQALHWLDDVAVCRGAARVLGASGHFFVVHSAFDVPDSHPLAHVLGPDSVLGRKPRRAFAREVQALHDRAALLFKALDTPGVERVDPTQREHALPPLASAGAALYRQQRVLGLGFLRGLLTPRHLEAAGLDTDAFWADAQARCAAATPAQLMGRHDWALLHFRRGARGAPTRLSACPVLDIGCAALG